MVDQDQCFIPGLPKEVGALCFAKVPLFYHHLMRGVCSSWRHVFHDDIVWAARRRLSVSEMLLLFRAPNPHGRHVWHCFHSSTKHWVRLPAIPNDDTIIGSSTSAIFDNKLFVIGGWLRDLRQGRRVASSEVSYFDMKSYEWGRTAPLNKARGHCIAGVVNNQLCICGGMTWTDRANPTGVFSSEVYNPIDGTWALISSMHKYYVTHFFSSKYCKSVMEKGVVHDPDTDEWLGKGNKLSSQLEGVSVKFDGNIYVKKHTFIVDRTYNSWVWKYDSNKGTWFLDQTWINNDAIVGSGWNDVGQQLLICGRNLCMVFRYIQGDQLQYVIKDLDNTVIASKCSHLGVEEKIQNPRLLDEEDLQFVEYQTLVL